MWIAANEAMKICKTKMPDETNFSDTHRSACWLNGKKAQGGGAAWKYKMKSKNTADDMRDVIVSVEHLKTYFNAGKTWGQKAGCKGC